MENTSENQDSPGKQLQNADLLLQRIADELAALRDADERKNKAAKRQTLYYSIIMGLILGFCVFNIVQQNGRLQDLESNQVKIRQTLQIINGEIAEELQRLDGLLSGEIPLDTQEPIITEQVFLKNITGKIDKQLQVPRISWLKNRQHFFDPE